MLKKRVRLRYSLDDYRKTNEQESLDFLDAADARSVLTKLESALQNILINTT